MPNIRKERALLDQVLSHFPAHTHPLTLVSDPDDVLADEQLWSTLVQHGFRLVRETDPFALRVAVRRMHPWSAEAPLVVITSGPLNALPYDLWQQGHHVTLELHQFFPNLVYPLVQALSPAQRARLAQASSAGSAVTRPLSPRETIEYMLRHVFHFALDAPLSLARWIAWLADYHAQNDPMPQPVAAYLLAWVKNISALRALPCEDMFVDADAYQRFVQREWSGYVQRQPLRLADPPASAQYDTSSPLPFALDEELQDTLPRLVRRGVVRPVSLPAEVAAPAWARPAIARDDESARLAELAEGLEVVEQQLAASEPRWEEWQTIARRWAEVSRWRYDPTLCLPTNQLTQYSALMDRLDDQFARWLATQYAPLGGRALPLPHHVYHVVPWLAYRRNQLQSEKPALLVMDGMSVSDWAQIHDVWQARHPEWHIHETLALAQIPSITSVSRLALISGRRPSQFAPGELGNQRESQLWSAFWEEQGVLRGRAIYAHLQDVRDAAYPAAITSYRTNAICLVSTAIDDMVHGATLGAAGLHAALDVWLQSGQRAGSQWLEGLLQLLLEHDFVVTITSDHGHTEATGIGPLVEGVLAGTRSKRARVYNPSDLAARARQRYPNTIFWENDGLLPPNLGVLIPQGRGAFTTVGERIVSHGGLSIDEMVVPLITLAKK